MPGAQRITIGRLGLQCVALGDAQIHNCSELSLAQKALALPRDAAGEPMT